MVSSLKKYRANSPWLIPDPGLVMGVLLAVCIQAGAFPDPAVESLDRPVIQQLEGDLSEGIDPGEEPLPSASSIEPDAGFTVALARALVFEFPFRPSIRLSARSPPALN